MKIELKGFGLRRGRELKAIFKKMLPTMVYKDADIVVGVDFDRAIRSIEITDVDDSEFLFAVSLRQYVADVSRKSFPEYEKKIRHVIVGAFSSRKWPSGPVL